MKDYRGYSYWLETCGDDLTPRPGVDTTVDVDVAILGAGFSGLWTAWYLLDRDPSLRIAIVEKEIAGFGASGRNGAWCTSGFPASLGRIEREYGRQAAVDTHQAMCDTVDEVGRVAADAGIDCDWHKGGGLLVARGPEQDPAAEHEYQTLARLGFGDRIRLLDRAETEARVRVAGTTGGFWEADTAVIHPGKLVRGLARALERRGVTIYEQTEVIGYSGGSYPALHTDRGHVRARTVVLCGEAWLSGFPQLSRQVVPIYSLITLTQPLSEADWAEIGWMERECVHSPRYQVDYLSKTADGRILFGGRGAPYHYGSTIEDAFDRHTETHRMLEDNVRTWFPQLRDVQFTHTWGGALGCPRDFMPTFSYDPRTSIASARGYTGNGVSTSNLAGRTIADLVMGIDSPLTHLPPANHRSPNWEPEPLRFLGIRGVQRGFIGLDRKAASTGKAPDGRSLVERMTRH